MISIRKIELQSVIENIELEIEFTDMTEEEEKESLAELKQAKEELKLLQ